MTPLLQNWKTSLAGLLTVTLATTAALLACPPVAAHPKWIVIGGGAQVVLKLWISLIQQDAGKTLAQVAGSATPQVVPSHEIPDDPTAKPL